MADMEQLSRDYTRVERAIRFLEENFRRQPALEEVAKGAGLSEYHFQRLFSRWVGISPKRFLQFLTKEYAKKLLEGSEDVLDVSYRAGLSGPGRLHDLFVSCEAMSPGEYKLKGEGMRIAYGLHPSPFGTCMLAVTERGICGLHFIQKDGEEGLAAWLEKSWPKATVVKDQEATRSLAERVFSFPADTPPAPLHLFVRGTNFQIKVWEALLKIPLGRAVSYEDVARHIGLPSASRAVGSAVGANPIPYLIPCHRVIKKMGSFGNYGEGPERKKAILAWEAALHERLSV
jgi:AraC family transcriptional regulator of adaptative response/methylated-DNA-[protein]-cysteine methyltransferase